LLLKSKRTVSIKKYSWPIACDRQKRGSIVENVDVIVASKKDKVIRLTMNYALYLLIIILFFIYNSLTPLFLSGQNIRSLITNSSALLVAATGMTFVLLIGEIDLSIGSVAGVASAIWIMLITKSDVPVIPATVISILVGGILGFLNSILIVRLKINSFLATMGMQIFLRGFVYIFTNGAQILMTPEIKAVNSSLKSAFFGLSPLLVFSLLFAIFWMLIYCYTSFGRKVQAVGCNKLSSKRVGINVSGITTLVYIICGMMAALAGIFQCTNVGMVNPSNVGTGMEFFAITACVLGGTSLLGGAGTIFPGTVIGVIFLNSIENGLGLLGVNAYAYPVVRGLVIYLAMVTDSFKRSLNIKK